MGEFPVQDEALRDSIDKMVNHIYEKLSTGAIILNHQLKNGDITLPHYCDSMETHFACLKEVFDINVSSTRKWYKTRVRAIKPFVRVHYQGQHIGTLVVMNSIEDLDSESIFIQEETYKPIHNGKGNYIKGIKLFGFKSLLFQSCKATPQQKYKLEKLVFSLI
ncbi:MAG: hypothetical protein R3250_11195 [Melioribacteraceae bacterium]|nr:hypothetical protein [Melioribacteraceae bacterium]